MINQDDIWRNLWDQGDQTPAYPEPDQPVLGPPAPPEPSGMLPELTPEQPDATGAMPTPVSTPPSTYTPADAPHYVPPPQPAAPVAPPPPPPAPAPRFDPMSSPDVSMPTRQAMLAPGTATPIQNPDGSVTTERTITVTEPQLNDGNPTNIPTVWNGRVVSDDDAVQNAIDSGRAFPAYGSIEEAEQSARRRSEDLGAGRATSIGGAGMPGAAPAITRATAMLDDLGLLRDRAAGAVQGAFDAVTHAPARQAAPSVDPLALGAPGETVDQPGTGLDLGASHDERGTSQVVQSQTAGRFLQVQPWRMPPAAAIAAGQAMGLSEGEARRVYAEGVQDAYRRGEPIDPDAAAAYGLPAVMGQGRPELAGPDARGPADTSNLVDTRPVDQGGQPDYRYPPIPTSDVHQAPPQTEEEHAAELADLQAHDQRRIDDLISRAQADIATAPNQTEALRRASSWQDQLDALVGEMRATNERVRQADLGGRRQQIDEMYAGRPDAQPGVDFGPGATVGRGADQGPIPPSTPGDPLGLGRAVTGPVGRAIGRQLVQGPGLGVPDTHTGGDALIGPPAPEDQTHYLPDQDRVVTPGDIGGTFAQARAGLETLGPAGRGLSAAAGAVGSAVATLPRPDQLTFRVPRIMPGSAISRQGGIYDQQTPMTSPLDVPAWSSEVAGGAVRTLLPREIGERRVPGIGTVDDAVAQFLDPMWWPGVGAGDIVAAQVIKPLEHLLTGAAGAVVRSRVTATLAGAAVGAIGQMVGGHAAGEALGGLAARGVGRVLGQGERAIAEPVARETAERLARGIRTGPGGLVAHEGAEVPRLAEALAAATPEDAQALLARVPDRQLDALTRYAATDRRYLNEGQAPFWRTLGDETARRAGETIAPEQYAPTLGQNLRESARQLTSRAGLGGIRDAFVAGTQRAADLEATRPAGAVAYGTLGAVPPPDRAAATAQVNRYERQFAPAPTATVEEASAALPDGWHVVPRETLSPEDARWAQPYVVVNPEGFHTAGAGTPADAVMTAIRTQTPLQQALGYDRAEASAAGLPTRLPGGQAAWRERTAARAGRSPADVVPMDWTVTPAGFGHETPEYAATGANGATYQIAPNVTGEGYRVDVRGPEPGARRMFVGEAPSVQTAQRLAAVHADRRPTGTISQLEQRATDATDQGASLFGTFGAIPRARAGAAGVEGAPKAAKPLFTVDGRKIASAQDMIDEINNADLLPPARMAQMLGTRPDYLKDVAQVILDQRQKVREGRMGNRDIAKAYFMTVASQGGSAIRVSTLEDKVPGFKVPEMYWAAEPSKIDGSPQVRPEEAAAAWLMSPQGKRALDNIEQGIYNPADWEQGVAVRKAWGDDRFHTNNVFSTRAPVNGRTKFNMTTIPQFTQRFNELAKSGDLAALSDLMERANGIAVAKGPFLKHTLGFGDAPTMDAVEINSWLTGQGDVGNLEGPKAELVRAVNGWIQDKRVGRALNVRIRAAIEDLANHLPPAATADLTPEVLNHVLHHWIWDRMKGTETTHEGFYRALRMAGMLGPLESTLPDQAAGRLNAALEPVNRYGGSALVGSMTGAGIGAAVDTEDPNRGAQHGALIGAGAGLAGTAALELRARRRAAQSFGDQLLDRGLGEAPDTAYGTVGAVPRAGGRRSVGQFQDTYESSGAKALMDTYARETPTRIARAEELALPAVVDHILGARATPEKQAALTDLLRRTIDVGERMLDQSKVVATGIGGHAAESLIAGEGLTNKFAGAQGIADAIDATHRNVGLKRITRPQAENFTRRELHADQVVLGAPNLNGRLYAHVTAGPPLISEAKPAMHLIWDNETPRVTSLHHHYALGSPDTGIHKGMPEPDKQMLWKDLAAAGSRLIETATGPIRDQFRARGVDIGNGSRMADTPWAVGPAGESRLRILQQMLSIPKSGGGDLRAALARGEPMTPQELASALLRESSSQQQPMTESAKAALGIPGKDPAIERQYRLGMAVNRSRSEALIVDPHPRNVKAIYLDGNGDTYLQQVIENTGGTPEGTKTRLQLAQEVADAIGRDTGTRPPIIFKDTSVEVGPEGPRMVSGGKSINDAEVIERNGSRRPLRPDEYLAPGREAIRSGYTALTDRRGNPRFGDIGGFVPGAALGAGAGAATDDQADDGQAHPGRAALGAALGVAASGGRGAPRFYSTLERLISEKAPGRASVAQIQAMLKKGAVKAEELAFTGLDDLLSQAAAEGRPVTKAELLDHLAAHRVEVNTVTRGETPELPHPANVQLDFQPVNPATAQARSLEPGARVWEAADPYGSTHRIVEHPPTLAGEQPWYTVHGTDRGGYHAGIGPEFDAYDEAVAAAHDRLPDLHQEALDAAGADTEYGRYVTPGGENYREHLLTLNRPDGDTAQAAERAQQVLAGLDDRLRAAGVDPEATTHYEVAQVLGWPEAERWRDIRMNGLDPRDEPKKPEYYSPHWDVPDVLAHVRTTDRTLPDGRRALHIEEIQSDWHQTGRRRGYVTPDAQARQGAALQEQLEAQMALRDLGGRLHGGEQVPPEEMAAAAQRHQEAQDAWRALAREQAGAVPDAPFKSTWPDLSIKAMLHKAATEGYDALTIGPGSEQVARYGTERVAWRPAPDGDGFLVSATQQEGGLGVPDRGQPFEQRVRGPQQLDAVLIGAGLTNEAGAPMASRVWDAMQATPEGEIAPRAEGMSAFYDRQLPQAADRLGRKFGARVEPGELRTGPDVGYTIEPQPTAETPDSVVIYDGDGEYAGTFPSEAEARAAIAARTDRGRVPVSVLPVTDELRRAVTEQGQPLFAGAPLVGAAAGADTGDEQQDPEERIARAGGGLAAGLALRSFPGVKQALAAAAQRRATVTPLSPLQWTRKLVGTVGYSSMLGPGAFLMNMTGNLLEPAFNAPKELARAVVRGNPQEAAVMLGGTLAGMGRLGEAVMDALAARGRYAAVPGHEPLSQQTINPLGHAIASALEAPGRVWATLPDAIFGTVAESAGDARAAAQLATDQGLKGAQWTSHVNSLLADARQARQGGTPIYTDTHQVLAEGTKYAKRGTFQDDLGTHGKTVRSWATLSMISDGKGGTKPIPMLGNLVTPFFNTPWNMTQRLAERTPVLGAFMNSHGSRFDKYYDQIVGSALMAGMIGGPAAAGKITGSGPDSPQERNELRAEGWRPYSVLVQAPGMEKPVYVTSRAFGIYAPLLNMVGDAHDAIAYAKKDDAGEMTGHFIGKLGGQLKQQPYLQGVADLVDLLGTSYTTGVPSGVTRYLSSTATRLVPFAATTRAIGVSQDPYERTTDRGKQATFPGQVWQQTRLGIGNRQGFPRLGQEPLPINQDVLGRDQTNTQQGMGAMLPQLHSPRGDATIAPFINADIDIPPPDGVVTRHTPMGSGIPVTLTPAETRRWNQIRGKHLIETVPDLASDPSFGRAPLFVQQRNLRRLLDQAARLADATLLAEPGMDQRVLDAAQEMVNQRGTPAPAPRALP